MNRQSFSVTKGWNMPAGGNETERDMDADLEDWGHRLQRETVPERLQDLAAQLRKVLLQRQLTNRKGPDH